MSGMVGRFMQSFGLTMAFAVMVSLFVSFTLTPMMSARWLKVKPRERRRITCTTRSTSAIFGPLDRVYTRMLEWAMAHRGIVAVARRAGAAVERAAVPDRQRQLHAAGRSVAVRRQRCARRKAPASTATEVLANRVATAIRADSRSRLHAGHGGRRCGRHAEHRDDLRAAAADRRARARSVRGHGAKSATTSCRDVREGGRARPPVQASAAARAAAAATSSS